MIPGIWTIDFWIPKGVGDALEILGTIIAIVGFVKAVRAANKAKSAADSAKIAAERARDSITMFETIVDFSAGIERLEEIKRMHRYPDALPALLDRYQSTRKLLIVIRNSKVLMTDAQKATIQNALTNLVEMERQVEKAAASPGSYKATKNNAILSADIDGLVAVLQQLKSQTTGGVS